MRKQWARTMKGPPTQEVAEPGFPFQILYSFLVIQRMRKNVVPFKVRFSPTSQEGKDHTAATVTDSNATRAWRVPPAQRQESCVFASWKYLFFLRETPCFSLFLKDMTCSFYLLFLLHSI